MNLNHFRKFKFANYNRKNPFLCRHKSTSSEYCINLVKTHDYENFVCTLLLKNTARSTAFAVRSFNIEIARIAEQVTQQNTALMRFKFWEDTLEKCLTKDIISVPKHPVAMELFRANNTTKFTKRYFNNIITSRKEYYNVKSFKNLEELETYVEKSVSNVFYLILEGCGAKNIHADHAASHLGKAQGLVQQLRSIPYARKINFLPIPDEILVKYRVSQEDVLRAKISERLNDCTYEIAVRAHQHLTKAKSLVENVPKDFRGVLLPAVPVSYYLISLEKVNYNVFHPSLKIRSWRLLPTLWITNFRNKY